jgi:hypothetical protein
VGWLQSCIKSFYKAGFSRIQDTAALAVICRRQQAAVIGMDAITRTNDTHYPRVFQINFSLWCYHYFKSLKGSLAFRRDCSVEQIQ